MCPLPEHVEHQQIEPTHQLQRRLGNHVNIRKIRRGLSGKVNPEAVRLQFPMLHRQRRETRPQRLERPLHRDKRNQRPIQPLSVWAIRNVRKDSAHSGERLRPGKAGNHLPSLQRVVSAHVIEAEGMIRMEMRDKHRVHTRDLPTQTLRPKIRPGIQQKPLIPQRHESRRPPPPITRIVALANGTRASDQRDAHRCARPQKAKSEGSRVHGLHHANNQARRRSQSVKPVRVPTQRSPTGFSPRKSTDCQTPGWLPSSTRRSSTSVARTSPKV